MVNRCCAEEHAHKLKEHGEACQGCDKMTGLHPAAHRGLSHKVAYCCIHCCVLLHPVAHCCIHYFIPPHTVVYRCTLPHTAPHRCIPEYVSLRLVAYSRPLLTGTHSSALLHTVRVLPTIAEAGTREVLTSFCSHKP